MSDAAAAAGTTTRPVNVLIVVAVVMTAVLEVLDSTIVNVALPHIQAAFGMTSDQAVWILTSYIVAAVVVMPLTGLLARRLGRRRLILTAITGFATFSALCGLSVNAEMLVACRLGQGLCGAFLIPLSQSILFDSFPREKRGQAMAMFGLGVIVAPVLGPTLGALLTEYFSWRAVFYVNIPVAGLALLLISGELEAEATQDVKIDWIGLGLMVAAIGALQATLDLGQTYDWFASRLLQVTALVALVAGITFLVRGWRLPTNIVDLSLLRDRSFAAANIAMMGFGAAMFGAIAILPIFVQNFLQYPTLDAGYLFMPRGIAAAFSMVVTGLFLVNRFDPRMLVIIGLTLTGSGNLLLSQLNLNAGFWDVALPGVVTGLGLGLFFVPMSTLAFQNISADRQNEASGIYGLTRQLGSSVGISIIGWQVADRTQYHWATLTSSVTPYDHSVDTYLAPLNLDPHTIAGAEQLAHAVMSQATMLAFQDAFLLCAITAFCMLPTAFLMQRPHPAEPGAKPSMAH